MTNKYRITIALWNNLWIITAFYWDKKNFVLEKYQRVFYSQHSSQRDCIRDLRIEKREERETDVWFPEFSVTPGLRGVEMCVLTQMSGTVRTPSLVLGLPPGLPWAHVNKHEGHGIIYREWLKRYRNTGVRFYTDVMYCGPNQTWIAQRMRWLHSPPVSRHSRIPRVLSPVSLGAPVPALAHGESCSRAEGDARAWVWRLSAIQASQATADGYIMLQQPPGGMARARSVTRYFNNSFMISFHSAWQNCSQNSCEEKLRHG